MPTLTTRSGYFESSYCPEGNDICSWAMIGNMTCNEAIRLTLTNAADSAILVFTSLDEEHREYARRPQTLVWHVIADCKGLKVEWKQSSGFFGASYEVVPMTVTVTGDNSRLSTPAVQDTNSVVTVSPFPSIYTSVRVTVTYQADGRRIASTLSPVFDVENARIDLYVDPNNYPEGTYTLEVSSAFSGRTLTAASGPFEVKQRLLTVSSAIDQLPGTAGWPRSLGRTELKVEVVDVDTGALVKLIDSATNATHEFGGLGFTLHDGVITLGQRVAARVSSIVDASYAATSATYTVVAGGVTELSVYDERLYVHWVGIPASHFPSMSLELRHPQTGARWLAANNATVTGSSFSTTRPCLFGGSGWDVYVTAYSNRTGEGSYVIATSSTRAKQLPYGLAPTQAGALAAGQPFGVSWTYKGTADVLEISLHAPNGSLVAAISDVHVDQVSSMSLPTQADLPTSTAYTLRYRTTAFGAPYEWSTQASLSREEDALSYCDVPSANLVDSQRTLRGKAGPFLRGCKWVVDVPVPDWHQANATSALLLIVRSTPTTAGALRIYDGNTTASRLMYRSAPGETPTLGTSAPQALVIFTPTDSADSCSVEVLACDTHGESLRTASLSPSPSSVRAVCGYSSTWWPYVVGGVVGGVGLVVIVVGIILCCCCCRRSPSSKTQAPPASGMVSPISMSENPMLAAAKSPMSAAAIHEAL
ncbi:hypothetical protein PAPYR_1508 [Paratrimastix pyriformis]|uniref:Uncharacterized protein n=1 Tax=Paratrimastix pyriformis TaxID=342808 RepID=A0ABQ8URS9_9EUKA|nr:hypothetical protein PAPYR_1508 [Paratrimastix pyriformis]